MLAKLSREETLSSLAECMREWILIGGIHLCDGDTRVMFVRFGVIGGGFVLF